MNSSQDIIYYNLTLTNIDGGNSGLIYNTNNAPQPATLIAYNNQPVIYNPDQYYCSIIRMVVPAETLPCVGPLLVQTPVINIDYLIYSFTLTYNGFTSGQVFWRFIPEDLAAKVPPTGTAQQTFDSNYYFIYDYNHMMTIMNGALANAMGILTAAAAPTLNGVPAPFFYYDPTTEKMVLYVDKTFFGPVAVPQAKIYFNYACNPFFTGMSYFRLNSNDPNGLDNIFEVVDIQGINERILTAGTFIEVPQQFQATSYFSNLKRIIVSTSMNINSEIFFINNPSANQNQNYISVLTDYIPDISQPTAGIAQSTFVYNADSLYRVFEFKQQEPLVQMDVRFFWSDALNNIYPITLDKSQNITIKFMFIRKSVFKRFIS